MEKDYEKRLGSAPVGGLVFSMALPSVVAQIVNLLYNIVDRIYIGHIKDIGTDALAGVGICSTLIILITAFAMFAGGGGAPLASMALGRGDRERAERMLGNGITLDIIFSLFLVAVIGIFMRPILMATGGSEHTIGYAMSYMSIYLVGTFFVMVSTGITMFINAQGQTRRSMISTVIGAAANIVLDPIFIFIFGMGVRGAAIATVISQVISALYVLHFLTSDRASLRLKRRAMKPDGPTIRSMLSLGISPFIMASTESVIGFVLNGSLVRYGDIYVSALSIEQSCMQFIGVPLGGFMQGCTPVISYNFGAKKSGRVKNTVKIMASVNLIYSVLLVALMMAFPEFWAGIFRKDPQLIDAVSRTLPTFVAGMSIFGLQRACQQTFVALNEARISVFIAFLRKIFLLVPLSLILPRFMGLMGVFRAEPIADISAAVCCCIIFAVRFPAILRKNEAEGGRPGKS